MQVWQAHYKDKQHDLDIVIENHYDDNYTEQSFKICIDGVIFGGSGLDDWELSETESNISDIMKKFSMLKYGSKETGYHYWLQSYQMQMRIPCMVFSLTEKRKISAELDIVFNNSNQENARAIYKLDGKSVNPNMNICERFALIVEGKYYNAIELSEYFEISMQSICKQIAGKYYLYNCFGCLYSDYSPYGQNNIGSLCCFVESKEKYLKVYGKNEGEYTIWDAFEEGFVQCQETAVCNEFAPRINCLGGYRGGIYE
ncbi:DUF6304 family protein [Anaerosporobacter sp.]|uniref:DUF6304 family protein n=1 Tax=Anaerosporobacter sp. TaxID=1872529 RepID=UPI00286F1A5B|nr:DUF6304 family protein [Anaerosporobacter sp.]